MKIVVLAGGNSTEREVSLSSGARIAGALRENGHRVLLLDLCLGIDLLPDDIDQLFTGMPAQETTSNLLRSEESVLPSEEPIGANVAELCRAADLVFLALHGGIGEGGILQAFLECNGVTYTGSDAVGSMLAMDKDLSKRIFRASGVPTPEWVLFDAEEQSFSGSLESVGFPCVVKPANGGSSVGVSFAKNEKDLFAALENAAPLCRYLLVERMIRGRELTIGVLGERTLPTVEILPPDGVYDYQNKYNGKTRELCPADLPPEICERIRSLALCAFRALRLRDYARFDFLLDADNRLWCLEGNTLPGMTPTSLFPKEAETLGISYGALCELLAQLANKRAAP